MMLRHTQNGYTLLLRQYVQTEKQMTKITPQTDNPTIVTMIISSIAVAAMFYAICTICVEIITGGPSSINIGEGKPSPEIDAVQLRFR